MKLTRTFGDAPGCRPRRGGDRSPLLTAESLAPCGRDGAVRPHATHYKGFDSFGGVTFHKGAEPLVDALRDGGFALTYMPAHEAAEGFPFTPGALRRYRAVILSDTGPTRRCCPLRCGCTASPRRTGSSCCGTGRRRAAAR